MLCAAESAHIIAREIGPAPEAALLLDLARGRLVVEPVHAADWERMAALVIAYADLGLGTVDASIVAAAERRGITTIATFDRRHFSVVRPLHAEAFDLVP